MSKYKVARTDGRDNKDEKYIVLRVDSGSKTHEIARKAAQVYIDAMAEINPDAHTEMTAFMQDVEGGANG
ncbi:MAG: hypothetical protein PHE67_02535 [Campylobacterales bacterium]|nr:hypothetical protein [Campylobacterales bacterium]